VPDVGWAELEIYDLKGSRVWTKSFTNLSAGRHTVTWEGTDAAGSAVATGVYFYRLRSEGFEQTRKMILVK
jgi:flagellar hook assembly protein FlgD